MKIDSLKDLKKLLMLCRQQGVQSIKVGDTEFHLGSLPVASKSKSIKAIVDELVPSDANIKIPQYTPIVADTIETDELTDEQKLFYSVASDSASQ
jgi:hypothetical protein